MTCRIGILGTERRTEGIDVAECHCVGLAVKLTADGKVCGFSEEVLCEVNGTVVVFRYVIEIKCCYAEHLPGAFTVASGNDRSVYIHEIALLKESVNRICRKGADTEHSLKQIRAGTKVGDRPEIFGRMTLFLKRIIGSGSTFDFDGRCMNFKRLRSIRSFNELSGNDE